MHQPSSHGQSVNREDTADSLLALSDRAKKRGHRKRILFGTIGFLIVAAGIFVAVYFLFLKKKSGGGDTPAGDHGPFTY